MTNHTNLIARLRKDDLFWKAPITCRSEAADAIEAAQTEIERLQTTVKHLSDAAANATFAEKAALARLAELTKQEPVMVYDGRCIWDCGDGGHQDVTMLKMIAKGTKLYAAAGASPVQTSQGLQSVADALTIEQLNDKVERLMAVQPSQAGELSTEQLLYVQSALKAVKQYGNIFRYERHQVSPYEKIVDALAIVDAAINAKESGK